MLLAFPLHRAESDAQSSRWQLPNGEYTNFVNLDEIPRFVIKFGPKIDRLEKTLHSFARFVAHVAYLLDEILNETSSSGSLMAAKIAIPSG